MSSESLRRMRVAVQRPTLTNVTAHLPVAVCAATPNVGNPQGATLPTASRAGRRALILQAQTTIAVAAAPPKVVVSAIRPWRVLGKR